MSSSVLERSENKYAQKLTWNKNFIFVKAISSLQVHKKLEAFFFFFSAVYGSKSSMYCLDGLQAWAETGSVLKGPAYSVTEAN